MTTLAYAGLGKLHSGFQSGETVDPDSLLSLRALAAVELSVCVWLLLPGQQRLAASASLVLFSAFSVYVGYKIKDHKPAACACFGSSRSLGPFALLRNIVLVVASIALLVDSAGWPVVASQVPATISTAALPWAFLLHLFDEADGMIARIKATT